MKVVKRQPMTFFWGYSAVIVSLQKFGMNRVQKEFARLFRRMPVCLVTHSCDVPGNPYCLCMKNWMLRNSEWRMFHDPFALPPSSSIIFSRILLTDDDDAGCKRDRHDATLNVRACMQDIGWAKSVQRVYGSQDHYRDIFSDARMRHAAWHGWKQNRHSTLGSIVTHNDGNQHCKEKGDSIHPQQEFREGKEEVRYGSVVHDLIQSRNKGSKCRRMPLC